jgi:hypothetical protein
LQALNVSTWGTNGSAGNGMYFGVGFDTTEMSNADIAFCYYNFTNVASNVMACYDTKTDSNNGVSFDASQDLYNVSTVFPVNYVRTTSSAATQNFIVKFTRPMITNDTSNDA